jgi:hypothetical protein
MLNTKVFKSSGPDNIPNRIIKDFAYELAEPVCHIFNTSLSTGEFPNIWKDALITPIPKAYPVSIRILWGGVAPNLSYSLFVQNSRGLCGQLDGGWRET